MKFKIFTMLVILGILSVTPMIYMGKFDPMAFIDDGMDNGASGFQKLKAKAPKNMTSVVTNEKVQVYKWRDEHGVMQFSNTPPPTVTNAQRIELNPDKNVIQAVKIPEKAAEPKAVVATEAPNPYSVRGMKKVMDDARGVEDLLKKREEEQRRMTNFR
jgi:hypothetical protein